jgi:glycoside/pentoside/hexuronide:cation symporter, GPH family
MSIGAKLVYAYISYALLMTAYTAVNIPYSALAGVMTSDQGRTFRPAIVAFRHGHGGRLSGDGFHLAALAIVGRRRQPAGTATRFSVCRGAAGDRGGDRTSLAALPGPGSAPIRTRRRRGSATRTNVFEDVWAMFRNSQWLIVSLAMFIIQIRGGLQGSVKPYFINTTLITTSPGVFAITGEFHGALHGADHARRSGGGDSSPTACS